MSLVYVLFAKSDQKHVRYVGRTDAETPDKRFWSHLYEARFSDNVSYKCNWIRKVLKTNNEVSVAVVERNLTFEQSVEREIFYIAHYRALGHKLTNQTLGGEGASGCARSEETKAKISLSKMGKECSAETRAKMRLANSGRVLSEEHKAKISLAMIGRVTSDVTRAKISAVLTSRVSRDTIVNKVIQQEEKQQKAQQKELVARQRQEKRRKKALLFSQLSDQDFQSLSKPDKISYKYWQRTAA